jgi:RNA polymerase sigma-70 factor
LDDATVQRFYERAGAARWKVPHEAFAGLLTASVRKAFADGTPPPSTVERYLAALHLEDLALACACAEGSAPAWDEFVVTYRPVLYRAADATGDSARAREVADSLYAELFGLTVRDGARRSHLAYYHGRSSLATWLRAVFAQRYVDSLRGTTRLDPLPDDESAQAFAARPPRMGRDALGRIAILHRVLAAAIAVLAPRDRLRLRCYYAQDLTLAQIGRLLGEHEATVSRHLTRTRREIRKRVEQRLRDEERMAPAAIAECFAAAAADSGTLDLAELLGTEADQRGTAGRKEIVEDRST